MAPVVPVGTRQTARLRNSSLVSKRSLSAAADLVVKPSTPPRMTATGVQRNAICLADTAAKPAITAQRIVRNTAVSERAEAAAYHLPLNSTEGAGAKADELVGTEIPSQTLVEEVPSQVFIEVHSLSGEVVLCDEFALADQVVSVKRRLQRVQKIPLWQQMLTFQGEIIHDQSKLQDFQLPSEGTVFELVIRAALSDQDMTTLSSADEILKEGTVALNTIQPRDIKEIKAFAKPPLACEKVCLAAMQVLVGLLDTIPVKRNGSPKETNWGGCKNMLADSKLMEQLRLLSSHIDKGQLSKERMDACRQQIQDTFPEAESDSDKIMAMGRCSLMCQRLLQYLVSVRNYFDSVTELSERYGGATIKELRANC